MANTNPNGEEHDSKPERIQDFIFARELAEVYLLLDHVSGRSDKTLSKAFDDMEVKDDKGQPMTGEQFIAKICDIGWPPDPNLPLGARAATLLVAKDRLNHAARPANGASIAFTLLVAGDDEVIARRTARRRARLRDWLHGKTAPEQPPYDDVSALKHGFEGSAPSRTSLARRAYPGLIATAGRFNRWYTFIVWGLAFWLIFTCLLSWNIAAGHASLVRLDALKLADAAVTKKVYEVEAEEARRRGIPSPNSAADQKTPLVLPQPATEPERKYIANFCDRAKAVPSDKSKSEPPVPQFDNATQYQLCDERDEIRRNLSEVRRDLSQWLLVWKILPGRSPANEAQDSWAAVLLEVLASAVLPICYGFLGAGTAAVRSIWAKMRDSLMSPRDLTLSLGQLALGAVIGACIGLFVTTSTTGSAAQGTALLAGPSPLSASALSFIAGFGVESVFLALESFIRRIFNIKDPTEMSGGR